MQALRLWPSRQQPIFLRDTLPHKYTPSCYSWLQRVGWFRWYLLDKARLDGNDDSRTCPQPQLCYWGYLHALKALAGQKAEQTLVKLWLYFDGLHQSLCSTQPWLTGISQSKTDSKCCMQPWLTNVLRVRLGFRVKGGTQLWQVNISPSESKVLPLCRALQIP